MKKDYFINYVNFYNDKIKLEICKFISKLFQAMNKL